MNGENSAPKKIKFKYFKLAYQLGKSKRKIFTIFALLSILLTAMSLVAQNIPRIIIDDVVPSFTEPKDSSTTEHDDSITEYDGSTSTEHNDSITKQEDGYTIGYDYSYTIGYDDNPSTEYDDSYTTEQNNYTTFFLLAALYLILMVSETFGRFITLITVEKASIEIVSNLKVRMFHHLTKIKLDFFHRNPVGRLIARVEGDVEKLRLVFSFLMVNIFGFALQSIAFFIYLFIYNFSMTIWLLIPVGLMLISSVIYQKLARPRIVKLRKKVAQITGYIAESITGIRTIQAFRNEKDFKQRFSNQVEEWRKEQLKIFFMLLVYFRGTIMLERLARWTIIFVFGLVTQSQTGATIGELIMFTSLVTFAVFPIRMIFERLGQIQEAFANLERIDGIMNLKREDGKTLYTLTEQKQDLVQNEKNIQKALSKTKILNMGIEFDNVWFAYDEKDSSEIDKKIFGHKSDASKKSNNKSKSGNGKTKKEPEWVLKGVSFFIPAGQSLALIGATGCGKTTIVKLLFRFYEPQKGRILLDGKDIRDYSLHELRAYIGLVQQENHLFPGTIKENITLDNDMVPEQKILERAKQVGSNLFIEKREDGYDSEVKEKGMNYSSGEKQLIAFTRCMVYNRPVLILDEATSNIDVNSEKLIQNTIVNMLGLNKTSIIIAHRLSTIRHANNIIVLDAGKVLESGNHDELIALNGKYKQYFKYQLTERVG